MKKVFALILALVMVLSLSTVAMAAGGNTTVGGTGNNPIGDVIVKVTDGGVTNVYSITIAWESLTFNYSKGSTRWNPTNHEYEESDKAGWVGKNTADITVTNYSDVAITVTGSVTDQSAEDGFVAALTNGFNLASYADQTAGNPASGEFTLTVTANGDPETTGANGVSIGTLSITIAKQ